MENSSLQSDLYSFHSKFYVALDCIIFGFEDSSLKILLQKRKFEPLKDELSLMGGFLEDQESLDGAARRITNKLTGLEEVYYEQLPVFGEINRDISARVLSVPYYALIKLDAFDLEITGRYGAFWVSINEIPNLIFDHNQMVAMALKKLRERCRIRPIGFELLPEKFTIPQLQSLYEAILGVELDKRNFRKKIFSMNLLDKLEEKDKQSSRKGAFYYRFNYERYQSLSKSGFVFEI
jgi:hypothetical protein